MGTIVIQWVLNNRRKVDQKNYILRLPNKEVKELFKDSFLEKYFGRGNKLSDLMEALTENRIGDYEEKSTRNSINFSKL